jgi:hypothetical protein
MLRIRLTWVILGAVVAVVVVAGVETRFARRTTASLQAERLS